MRKSGKPTCRAILPRGNGATLAPFVQPYIATEAFQRPNNSSAVVRPACAGLSSSPARSLGDRSPALPRCMFSSHVGDAAIRAPHDALGARGSRCRAQTRTSSRNAAAPSRSVRFSDLTHTRPRRSETAQRQKPCRRAPSAHGERAMCRSPHFCFIARNESRCRPGPARAHAPRRATRRARHRMNDRAES